MSVGTTTGGSFYQTNLTTGGILQAASGGVLSSSAAISGIVFGNGTSAPTALTYSVGTFTPTLTGGTVAGTTTYTTQVGAYIKIGQLVLVTVDISISAATGTGNAVFGALPYTINSPATTYYYGAANTNGATWPAAVTSIACVALPNTTTFLIQGCGTTISNAALQMQNASVSYYATLLYTAIS